MDVSWTLGTTVHSEYQTWLRTPRGKPREAVHTSDEGDSVSWYVCMLCVCLCIHTCVRGSANLQELWVFLFEKITVRLWEGCRYRGKGSTALADQWVSARHFIKGDTLSTSFMKEWKCRNVNQGHNRSLWLQSSYFVLNGDFFLLRKEKDLVRFLGEGSDLDKQSFWKTQYFTLFSIWGTEGMGQLN